MKFSEKTIWTYVASVSSLVCAFVFSLVSANTLGPARFGLFSFLSSIVTLCFLFFDLRVAESLIYFMSPGVKLSGFTRSGLVRQLSLLSLIGSLLGIGLSLIVYWTLNYFQLAQSGLETIIIIIALGVVPNLAFQPIITGTSRAFGLFKLHAILSSTTALAQLAIAIILVISGNPDVTSVAFAQMVSLLITIPIEILIFFAFVRHLFKNELAASDKHTATSSDVRAFTLRNYYSNLWNIPMKELDVILLGACATNTVVGSFKLIRNIFLGFWMLSDPVFFALLPEFRERILKNELVSIRELTKSFRTLVLKFGFLIPMSFWGVTYFILSLKGFSEFKPNIVVILIYGLALPVWASVIWARPLTVATGNTKGLLRTQSVSAIGYIIMAPCFIYLLTDLGASLAQVIGLITPSLLLVVLYYTKTRTDN